MRTLIPKLALLGILIFSSSRVFSEEFPAQIMEQLVMTAQTITQGRVAAQSSFRDAKGRIWTTYTVEIQDQLKGTDSKTTAKRLTIRQLGGTVGGVTMRASGVAHFTTGEDVLLFARDFGSGAQSVFNTPMGALRIIRDNADVTSGPQIRQTVAQPAARVHVAGKDEDLEQFKVQIREIVNRQKANKK
jgi:hypothetical protein